MVQFYRHICSDDQAQDIAEMLAVILVKAAIGQIGQDYAFSERRACGL